MTTHEPWADLAETHSAIVLFAGDRAYKLKKPVQFDFLDFSTRERREEAVRREVELNRRLAPDVYLGVSDVLDVSSIVTGKIRLSLEPRDLALPLRAAGDVVRPAADVKGVAVRVTLPDEQVLVSCDADRMQQVFWNLLSNAVKFTPRGGVVTVTLAVRDHSVLVDVSDTGIGLRPESLPFLFQRFWQAENVHTRFIGGMGLGLALARHFVELHGGTINAASEGEGRGSTFTVTLPRASNHS